MWCLDLFTLQCRSAGWVVGPVFASSCCCYCTAKRALLYTSNASAAYFCSIASCSSCCCFRIALQMWFWRTLDVSCKSEMAQLSSWPQQTRRWRCLMCSYKVGIGGVAVVDSDFHATTCNTLLVRNSCCIDIN